MFEIEDLQLRHWAKTLAYDYNLESELSQSKIIIMTPKDIVNFKDWTITKVTTGVSFKTKLKYVIFYAQFELKGQTYTQRIKIFTPYFPRVDNLEWYLNKKITGGIFVCGLKNSHELQLIAQHIKVTDPDTYRKSNPVMTFESKIDENVYTSNYNYQIEGFVKHPALKETTFFNNYYFNKKIKNYIPSHIKPKKK